MYIDYVLPVEDIVSLDFIEWWLNNESSSVQITVMLLALVVGTMS